MAEITQILDEIRNGSTDAADRLLEVVYDELRCMAAGNLKSEKAGQSLQATALVHEAWLRLLPGAGRAQAVWENRRHFFSAAAEAMFRILVEKARARKRLKRGGQNVQRQLLDSSMVICNPIEDDVLDLQMALTGFEQIEPLKARIVKLKFFAGLTNQEVAEVTELSLATVERYWAFARAWLHRQMSH